MPASAIPLHLEGVKHVLSPLIKNAIHKNVPSSSPWGKVDFQPAQPEGVYSAEGMKLFTSIPVL